MTRTQHRYGLLAGLLSACLPFVASADEPAPASSATEAKAVAPRSTTRSPPSGWRIVMRGSTVYWCTKQKQTGSRIRNEERCMTPDQYDALQEASKRMVDDLRRASPPPKGG
jgi:hypothetical protein